MLFGLSYNALGGLGVGAFVYMYGMQYQATRGLAGAVGGPGIAALVAGGAAYYLGLGSMVANMLGM